MITQARAKELFEYRDGKLYWKVSPTSNVKVGQRAGGKLGRYPYQRIRIKQKHHVEHRLIFLMFRGYLPKYIDHIVDDLTDEHIKDNHIENLRAITTGANIQKSHKTRGNSKYRGVYWNKRENKFHSQAYLDNKRIHLGYFNIEINAARAYDFFVKKHFGKHCFLNFPGHDTYLHLGAMSG